MHVENLQSLQSLNEPRTGNVSCGRGLAWSMISACQNSVQQNADDPGGRVMSGPGVQIPAAAPFTTPTMALEECSRTAVGTCADAVRNRVSTVQAFVKRFVLRENVSL